MSSKVSSINLWDAETLTSKLDIEVSSSKVDVSATGSQYIKIHPVLSLVNTAQGEITDVATKIHSIDAAIAAGNAGSAAASQLVQQNLDAYITSNNASVASISATVTTNKAISDQNHQDDAAARTALESALETKVTDEETARIAADDALTVALTTESNTRSQAISTEQSTRSSAVSNLQTQLDTERARVDTILQGSSVDLDSFLELVSNYNQLNTDALAQISALQTQVASIQAVLDALTE